MTQRKDDGSKAMRAVCWALAVWLFAAAPGAYGATLQDAASESLDTSRAALVDGTATEYELGRHVAALLAADDLETLSVHLLSGHPVVSKVIMETLAFDDDVRFVEPLLQLAGSEERPLIAAQAGTLVNDQARQHEQVRIDLVAMLAASAASNEGLHDCLPRTLIGALGQTRELTVVPALLTYWEGQPELRIEPADEAAILGAFEQLSGHSLPQGADAHDFWNNLWTQQQQQGLGRDVLLEAGYALQQAAWSETSGAWDDERARLKRDLQGLKSEVAEARIAAMGKLVDRLIEGLDDPYAEVRRAAAQGLADHPAHEKAAVAIPALLQLLGHGEDSLIGNGAQNGEARVERHPGVRATIVSALGNLGRDRPEVMTCLLAELSENHLAVARAAVDALAKVKGQPMVVRPLLDFLTGEELDPETRVQVLEIIASNNPAGVFDELSTKLSVARAGDERAVLVQAMIASEELGQAMAVLSVLETSSEPFEVRFALAQWLGERVKALPLDAAPRPGMVSVIESLLSDADVSVRAQAAKSLGESGDPGSAALLTERAKHEVSASVLLEIVSALGQVGSLECVPSIGWIQAHDTVSDGAALNERAREALRAIGRGRPWTEWLTMAQALTDAEAPSLGLGVINEVLAPRAEGLVIEADVADRARGLKAKLLVAVGATEDAHDLLLQLEDEGKAFPSRELRWDLLAQTSRDLSLHSEAADWLALLLEGRVEADARFDELQRSLAGELLAARRYDEGLELLESLHGAQPSDNQLMLWYGQALVAGGRVDEARSLLERLQLRVVETAPEIFAEAAVALDQLDRVAAEVSTGDEGLEPEIETPQTEGPDEVTPSPVVAEDVVDLPDDNGDTGNR